MSFMKNFFGIFFVFFISSISTLNSNSKYNDIRLYMYAKEQEEQEEQEKTTRIDLTKKEIEEIVFNYLDKELNKKNVDLLINHLNIQFPMVVLSQAILESGSFSSELATKGNNLFGMRKPSIRQNFTLKKTMFGYATYKHWAYSVADYKLWQGNKKIDMNYCDYLKKRKYAQDPNYFKKIRNILKNNF